MIRRPPRSTLFPTRRSSDLDSSPVRPTVDDEREHVGFYLVQVLYRVIPVLYESLQQALRDTYGEELPLPRLLRFGTWVGGDMDGNPNVDAHTSRNTLQARQRDRKSTRLNSSHSQISYA